MAPLYHGNINNYDFFNTNCIIFDMKYSTIKTRLLHFLLCSEWLLAQNESTYMIFSILDMTWVPPSVYHPLR